MKGTERNPLQQSNKTPGRSSARHGGADNEQIRLIPWVDIRLGRGRKRAMSPAVGELNVVEVLSLPLSDSAIATLAGGGSRMALLVEVWDDLPEDVQAEIDDAVTGAWGG